MTTNVTYYVNALNSVGCNICIDKHTRIAHLNKSTCIDHVYSNLSCHRLDTKIITSDVSDHFSTLTKISGIPKNSDNDEVIYFRKSNLNEDEWKNFNLELMEALNESLPQNCLYNDVNSCADKITNAYKKVVDKFMPLKMKNTKTNIKKKNSFDKPWFTPGLKISREEKNRLFDCAKDSKNLDDYKKYKKYRNRYTWLKFIAR